MQRGQKRAVEIGSGVAILPEETIRAEVANQTLTAVRLEGNQSRPLAIIGLVWFDQGVAQFLNFDFQVDDG